MSHKSRTIRGVITRLVRLLAPAARRVTPATGSLGALGCGVAAAWTQGLFWGLIGTGGALLLAEWRMVEPKPGEQ